MKSDAVKLELIEWLAKVDDEGMLAAMLHIKNASQEQDWADDLSPKQLLRVEEGLQAIKKGKTIPRKQLWQKYGRKI